MPKDISPKLKNACKNFLRSLAGRPLPTFLTLFLIVLIIGAILFYQYSTLIQRAEPEIKGESLQFQENLYQQILKEWQIRNERFEAADSQKYVNPFQEKREKLILSASEEPKVISADPKLLGVSNLSEFYALKGEKMPLLNDRAKMWQEFGLGSAQNYIGSDSQNQLLLAELKKRLTPL